MIELIDKNKAIEEVRKRAKSQSMWDNYEVEELIKEQPTIIQQNAKWIVGDCVQDIVKIICSHCNSRWHIKRWEQFPNYCPNCGSKMINGRE